MEHIISRPALRLVQPDERAPTLPQEAEVLAELGGHMAALRTVATTWQSWAQRSSPGVEEQALAAIWARIEVLAEQYHAWTQRRLVDAIRATAG